MNTPVLIGENSCDYKTIKFKDFILNHLLLPGSIAYVKDWHFQRFKKI